MRCLTCKAEVAAGGRLCSSCGTPLDEIPNGTIIGEKFRITGRIGSGGMGRVYVAEHITLGRKVAVKILHHKYLGKRDLLKRFKSEALAASRMNHPNIVPVHDFGEDDSGQLFIVMDYVEGMSLEAVLGRDWPMGDARILHIAIQILRALEEAHSHGILHRDLKPENILLEDRQDQVDQVHVLDFGLAKALDEPAMGGMSRITEAGSTCGTPEYMSPEQAQGADLDPRSDIYSMGVLLYRMVVGRPPFMDRNPISVAAKHVTDQVPIVGDIRPGVQVSPEVEACIYKALSKKRAERFSSAGEMRDHLLDLLSQRRDATPLVDSLDSVRSERPPFSEETQEARIRSPFDSPPAGGPRPDESPAVEAEPSRKVSQPWSGAEVAPKAKTQEGRGPALGIAIFAGLIVAAAVVVVLQARGLMPSSEGVPPLLKVADPGVEMRPRDAPWMAAAAPRQMAIGDRLRADIDGTAEMSLDEAVIVKLVRAEVEIAGNRRLELIRGAVLVRHPGGDMPPVEVRVTAARGTARMEAGAFRVEVSEPAGMKVTNTNGKAQIEIPSGVVPVGVGTEVSYEPGKDPTSRSANEGSSGQGG